MQSLARIPFFRDAPDLEFDRFDRRVNWRRFEENEIIVDYEDDSTDIYFIISGDVRILVRTAAGKEIILAEMRAGQYFGELAAIDGTKRSANVSALTRCEMCIVPAAVFHEILKASPASALRLMILLVSRIRELNARLMEHSVLDLRHRLYAELLRLSAQRSGHQNERIVSPPPYHHVLANRIGCRREQVTRELSSLSTEALIEKTRGGIVLKKPDVLQHRINLALNEAN
jgi:CRP/FNR family transcriptional regulator, cyclic AMP receptor protein